MPLLINFVELFTISAPWLLLGLFIAGLISAFLPQHFLIRHLGKEGFLTTIKAALIGAPMPLCSCGVIPAALGLRRAGASKSATTAFLVSTPETGVDSVSISYVLLGPFLAIIRPIAAISSAIVAGVLVGKDKEATSTDSQKAALGCCHNNQINRSEDKNQQAPPLATDLTKKERCCSDQGDKHFQSATFTVKLKQAFSYSTTSLLRDTSLWLMIGLFFAAVIQTYVPAGFMSQWGGGIAAMLVVILISIPMYICATASTPIAAGLLLSGVSPGAALVFMLAGPATNIATLGVVYKELGKREAFAYLVGVVGTAVAFGLLTNFLVDRLSLDIVPQIIHAHSVLPDTITYGAAAVLLLLLLRLVFVNKPLLSKHKKNQV